MPYKVLSIGLGGVGVIANYTLQKFNSDVETTAIIRSDYDTVIAKGYTISSIDYGGRSQHGGEEDPENNVQGYKPHNVVKTLAEATKFGPFDFIVVSTKVIPQKENNIWDELNKFTELLLPNKGTSVVLLQNGIGLEILWEKLLEKVNLISGVSYISSVNDKGTVTQYGHDYVLFGLFDQNGDKKALETFIELYKSGHNSVLLDNNVAYTRWKKLLYNASFNTACCLVDADVGLLFDTEDVINEVIVPLMREVKYVSNLDLSKKNSDDLITDKDIDKLLKITDDTDARNRYQPSMLVDFRQGRPIELEVILGNVIKIFELRSADGDTAKDKIPYLKLLYHLLKVVQLKLQNAKA